MVYRQTNRIRGFGRCSRSQDSGVAGKSRTRINQTEEEKLGLVEIGGAPSLGLGSGFMAGIPRFHKCGGRSESRDSEMQEGPSKESRAVMHVGIRTRLKPEIVRSVRYGVVDVSGYAFVAIWQRFHHERPFLNVGRLLEMERRERRWMQ